MSTSSSTSASRGVDRLGDFLQLGAGVGVPDAVLERDQQAGRLLVMLVLDLADDLLDQVLDRDQPLGAAELVDDDGEMDALGAHPREQIEHAHRFGHVERRRISVGDVGGRLVAARPEREHVLDVDHADDRDRGCPR